MLTPEDHRQHLRRFEVDRLLKLLELEAQRSYDGYYTIFRFHSGFKVAFGIPGINPPGCRQQAYAQLHEMTHYPTLKDAIIEAMVAGKTFEDYFDGDEVAWWREGIYNDPPVLALWRACQARALPISGPRRPPQTGGD
jgi:hypothetical protein